jgi:tetratricopeptide (TPR) repeat protein
MGGAPDTLRILIVVAAACVGFFFVFVPAIRKERRRAAPFKAFLAAYRKGDYATALKTTEQIQETGNIRSYLNLRGGVLMQLGQLDEAERLLTQAVAMAPLSESRVQGRGIRGGIAALGKEIRLSALHRSCLGALYIERGRYKEAMECFEASLRDWPGHGPFHARMAEVCLRRGDAPAEALKWATLAVEEDRTGKAVSQETHGMNLSESLGTLAWATAVASKDRAQVDRVVDEAIKLAARCSVPTSAQVHFESGLAYTALDDRERGRQYWEEAARIDPQGRWGRAARAKLREP